MSKEIEWKERPAQEIKITKYSVGLDYAKIIICGAGVGSNIAKQLVYEDNDVTVIDESEVLLRSLSKMLISFVDLRFARYMVKAGADDADIMI